VPPVFQGGIEQIVAAVTNGEPEDIVRLFVVHLLAR